MAEFEAESGGDCRGYVLCGGRGSRMSQDKALLPMGEEPGTVPLVLWTAELVKRVTGNVTLVGSREKYSHLGLPVEEDVYPGLGPLGGIHSALLHAKSALSIVVACDMPYLTAKFLQFLIDIARTSGADVVLPESRTFEYNPLCAVYSRDCLPVVEEALRAGDPKVRDVLKRLRLRVVSCEEWRPFDPDGRLFVNLNTPEEYEEARRSLSQKTKAVPA